MKDSTCPAVGAGTDTRVVRAAIHPAPREPGFYRDAAGALTREAACYQWQIAMDIPEAATTVLPRRNAKVTVAARDTLAIDAGAQRIQGPHAAAVACTGHFTGMAVQIGELRTDGQGGCCSCPATASPHRPGAARSSSRGMVIPSSVPMAGTTIPATAPSPPSCASMGSRFRWRAPGWSAPRPTRPPQVKAERTLYDLLHSLCVQACRWAGCPSRRKFRSRATCIPSRSGSRDCSGSTRGSLRSSATTGCSISRTRR